jgi:1,4-dihydroxy-2-naphthoyl-CoA synthase
MTVNRSVLAELDGHVDYERRIATLARATDDAVEGPLSFREKRDPHFTGH